MNAMDAPDRPGVWWYRDRRCPEEGWALVEARTIGGTLVCLYCVGGKPGKNWGGYNMEHAKDCLPGEWVFVPEPQDAVAEALGMVFRLMEMPEGVAGVMLGTDESGRPDPRRSVILKYED